MKNQSLIILFTLFLISCPALATWSVVALDTRTQEVAVGSATCVDNTQVPGIDLRMETPALIVGVGAGAAQSLVDSSSQRRQTMFNGFINGTSASQIVTQLEALPNNALNQHGVVGAGNSSATQTGDDNFRHASGLADVQQGIYYAVQGNVLTGPSVVSEAINALISTPGALPEKLMAAMQAARFQGGDGRCSCPGGPNADSCGAPPPSFAKSAHVGYMIVARIGDLDDTVCNTGGCADGDYYMNFNVADQPPSADDPVAQLQVLFDDWRTGLAGVPDGVESDVVFSPSIGGFDLIINLNDFSGTPISTGGASVTVAHTADSDSLSMIGLVQDLNNGSYSVPLSLVSGLTGTDRFLITIDSGGRNVVIAPNLAVLLIDPDFVFADGFE